MLNHSARISLKVFLSALVLIGALVPAGVRHAHSGTDGLFSDHGHCDNAGHGHEPVPAGDSGSPSLTAGEALWHIHLTLLGIDFTLPDSNDQDDDEGSGRPDDMMLGRVIKNAVRSVEFCTGFDRPSTSSGCQALGSGDVTSLQAVNQSPPQVTSAPLCDSARLERSGVLLA